MTAAEAESLLMQAFAYADAEHLETAEGGRVSRCVVVDRHARPLFEQVILRGVDVPRGSFDSANGDE